MNYNEKSVCGAFRTGLHYELIRLKIGYLKLILEGFLHIEFQQNMRNFL
jgi:hypothetical protein